MISISTGVLDNDHKGLSGRGTKFFLEVIDGDEVFKYEYFLMDLLDKSFDKESIIKPFLEKKKQLGKEQEEKEKAFKVEELKKRESSINVSKEIEVILDAAIMENTASVKDFLSGKEKALNSIVGQIMKKAKEYSIVIDGGAFAVTVLLKKKLTEEN